MQQFALYNFSHSVKWIVVDCCSSDLYFITASGLFMFSVFPFWMFCSLNYLFIYVVHFFFFELLVFLFLRCKSFLYIINNNSWIYCMCSKYFPQSLHLSFYFVWNFLNRLRFIQIDMLISQALQLESI